MSDGSSPGLGFLVGMNLESTRQKSAAHAQELAEMRAKLREAISGGIYDTAFAKAAAEVTAEIVDELDQAASGATVRRLSDPRNPTARNEEFAKRAASHVRRMSEGRIKSPEAEIARIQAKNPLK